MPLPFEFVTHLKRLVHVHLNCMGKADDFNTTMGTITGVSFMAQALSFLGVSCNLVRVSCSRRASSPWKDS